MRRRSTGGTSRPSLERVQILRAPTARALLAGFRALGLDLEALRLAARVSESELAASDGMLSSDAFPRLFEEAFRQAPREELPTELGLAIPFGEFGALDYLAGSSPDVESAFQALQSHFRQVARIRLEIVAAKTLVDVRVVYGEPFAGQEVSDEMTLAIIVGRFRADAAGLFRVNRVRLTRPAPRKETRHAALFGAPVTFGCAVAGLEIPLASWKAPLRRADPALKETLQKLAALLELGFDDDLVLALRARLRTLLPEGKATASHAARTLGLSERTLHRRLRELDKTWRGVLDAFREAEAERLLTSTPAALSELAYRLGFSDQTSLNRAFRRWKGTTPTEWMRARSGPGGASPRR